MDLQFIAEKTILLVIVWLSVWGAMTFSVLYHEEGHKVINSNNNIDSTVQINSFGLSGITIPKVKGCAITPDNCASLIQQQSNHESIGYTFIPIWFSVLFFCGLVVSFFVLQRSDKNVG